MGSKNYVYNKLYREYNSNEDDIELYHCWYIEIT